MGNNIIERFRLTWSRTGGSEKMETVFEECAGYGQRP